MKPNAFARGLFAATVSLLALAGCTGVARAEPEPNPPPPLPPSLDESTIDNPSIFTNPADRGRPPQNWGGTGMYCQNLWVDCQ
jgi:hypothetical protein